LRRIEDHALLSDCETAALVARDATIDWMCVPRFDSGACFASLLGDPEHGEFSIRPRAPIVRTTRAYHRDSLVLETNLETDEGAIAIIDAMPLRVDGAGPTLARMIVGRRGVVHLRAQIIIRFEYGSVIPWVRRTETGIVAVAGPDRLRITTSVPLHGEGRTTVADFVVREGERFSFVLDWSASNEALRPSIDASAAVAETNAHWRKWISRMRTSDFHRDAVVRSLLTLKALTYRPTGGIIAAPTTSLPERIGGFRNWDYRYCWLRDSTFATYALLEWGFIEEAAQWREWLERAIAGSPEEAQILYGVSGERRLIETELSWLPGHLGSRPVRIGNAASRQFQLDIYGEVLDTMNLARRAGIPPTPNAWRVETTLADFVADAWHEPDDGVWEMRGPRQHFTYSKIMAWVALDRAVRAVERFGLPGRIAYWRAERDRIHNAVCRFGFDPERGSFVQSFGSKELDASLLLIPQMGFLPAKDPRMLATIDTIMRELSRGGLIRRYRPSMVDDGLPGDEGEFVACSFWLVDALVLAGRASEAERLFEHLVSIRNDVGLLSEEYDPIQGRMLGNFPQALSHIALLNSARNLVSAKGPARHRTQQGALHLPTQNAPRPVRVD
jgi:GH15 family glucan-1,4-alpha-glucosidase